MTSDCLSALTNSVASVASHPNFAVLCEAMMLREMSQAG